jgi:hypothetical protein
MQLAYAFPANDQGKRLVKEQVEFLGGLLSDLFHYQRQTR